VKRWRYYVTAAGKDIAKDELSALDPAAKAVVLQAMSRHRSGKLFPREEEHIDGDLHAIRVFFGGCTYRVLYAYEGQSDQVLLALHVITKKQRRLSPATRKLALKRLADWRGRARLDPR